MEICMPVEPSAHCLAVDVLLTFCGAEAGKVVVRKRDQAALSAKINGTTITSVNTICKAIADLIAPHLKLRGSSREDEALVDEHLASVHSQLTPIMDAQLAVINSWLSTRTYILGTKLSLADFVLYAHLSAAIASFPKAQRSVFCHLLRWYDYLHHTIDSTHLFPRLTLPSSIPPTPPPASARPPTTPAATTSATQPSKSSTVPMPATPSVSSAAPAKDKVKGKGKPTQGGAESAPPPAAPADDKAAKKAERAAKNAAKQAAPSTAAAGPRIDQLDVRVGTIVAVKRHPNAESLYLEEIDVAEDKPRQVISGLVQFVPEPEMLGRRVAVVVNLKPAKMRDIVSYGMVLCAANDAHDVVEPCSIPAGVPNGERLMCDGFPNDADAQLNPKKKVLEALKPDMKTNADGVACFQGIPFMTSQGPVTSTLKGASVQ